jgi:hypothetical protein
MVEATNDCSGSIATDAYSDSSPESGRWKFAFRKLPLADESYRPVAAIGVGGKRSLNARDERPPRSEATRVTNSDAFGRSARSRGSGPISRYLLGGGRFFLGILGFRCCGAVDCSWGVGEVAVPPPSEEESFSGSLSLRRSTVMISGYPRRKAKVAPPALM